jgi:hypothetical protein
MYLNNNNNNNNNNNSLVYIDTACSYYHNTLVNIREFDSACFGKTFLKTMKHILSLQAKRVEKITWFEVLHIPCIFNSVLINDQ